MELEGTAKTNGRYLWLTSLIILLVLEQRWPEQTVNMRLGIFGLSLTGTLYSGYLTYLEIAVLRAICPFCVVSAIAIFVILTAGLVRLRSSLTDIY